MEETEPEGVEDDKGDDDNNDDYDDDDDDNFGDEEDEDLEVDGKEGSREFRGEDIVVGRRLLGGELLG